MLTTAVRDLKKSYPEFKVNVDTTAMPLWDNNPHLDRSINEKNADKVIEMHYPLINSSNQLPYHFAHAFRKYLEEQLNISIKQGECKGEVFLNKDEYEEPSILNGVKAYWIIDAGYKNDYTLKNWGIDRFQKLVDILKGKITFVQVGKVEPTHKHPLVDGAINLVGQTNIREFIKIMYHAKGVVSPVSFPMHLAAAVPTKNGEYRPCIVLNGGREPQSWVEYPSHQFLHTIGMLPCCAKGACWKSRAEKLNDGWNQDNSICPNVVRTEKSVVGACMDLIKPEEVANLILKYK